MQGCLLPGCGGKNDSPASLLLSMPFESWSLVTATGAQRFFFAGKTRFATEIPPSHDGLTLVIQMTDSVLFNATRTNHIRLLAVMNQTKRRQMLREVPAITCPTQVNWGTEGMLGPCSTVGQLQRHPLPHCSHQKTKIPWCHLPCQTFLQGDAAAETASLWFPEPSHWKKLETSKKEKNLYNKSSEVNTSTRKRSDPAGRHL